MNCPRCGKQIGGYVQAGTKAEKYVSEGRCPHCGGYMPAGYKVGFENDFKPKPVKYNRDAAELLNSKGPYMGVCTILNGVIGCVFSILNHHIITGIIFAVVVIGIAIFYYFLYAKSGDLPLVDRYGNIEKETKNEPIGRSVMILSLIAGFAVSLFTYTDKGPNLKLFYWLIGVFAVSLIIQSFAWKYSYKWAKKTSSQIKYEAREKAKEEVMLQNLSDMLLTKNFKCDKCGKANSGHYSVAIKGGDGKISGAVTLCEDCLPWKEGGTTQVGDLKFIHLK